MKISGNMSVRAKLSLNAARVLAFAATTILVLTNAAQVMAQPQAQSAPPNAPVFEYEVASIKPSPPPSGNGGFMMGLRYTDDGFAAENYSLLLLVQTAFGVSKERISGLPDWVSQVRYDIQAKMDSAAADELKKLDPNQLKLVRQQMLQALLADRFKLTLHRETKDLPLYTLVIAKNGPKIQESKPDDTPAGGSSAPSGPSAPKGSTFSAGPDGKAVGLKGGASQITFGRGGARTASAKKGSMASLASSLSEILGRPVFDKTGLTGKYDYSLKWTQDDSQLQTFSKGGPGDSPSPDLSDSGGPTLFTALQEQLGLKLESGKGPVEIIVIDHIEKASGN